MVGREGRGGGEGEGRESERGEEEEEEEKEGGCKDNLPVRVRHGERTPICFEFPPGLLW